MKKEVVWTFRLPDDESAIELYEGARETQYALNDFESFLFSGVSLTLAEIQDKFKALFKPFDDELIDAGPR